MDSVSPEFSAACKKELSRFGYYRTNQTIRIRALHDDTGKGDIIELNFAARLILVNDRTEIYKPEVIPPDGCELEGSPEYFINGQALQSSSRELTSNGHDELIVRYRVVEPERSEIDDDHNWPCPVRDFSVIVPSTGPFSVSVSRKKSGSRTEELVRRGVGANKDKEIVYFSDDSAFTLQGIRWTVKRQAAVAGSGTIGEVRPASSVPSKSRTNRAPR
jgi:hypothetical protein